MNTLLKAQLHIEDTDVAALMELAVFFDVEVLRKWCLKTMIGNIGANNVWNIFEIGRSINAFDICVFNFLERCVFVKT